MAMRIGGLYVGGLLLWVAAAHAQPEPVDLLVVNGQVLTLSSDERSDAAIHEQGVVAIRDKRIVAVGGPELAARFDAVRTIDADGGMVMPGMINLHNHLAMVAFRGIGENAVEDVVREVMFPLEAALLDRTLIRVASRHAAMELALAGVTMTADMYYHEDEVAKSVAEVGIRGVLGETVIGFPVVDAPEPYGGLAYARKFIQDWQGHPLIIPAIAPHAPYTVTAAYFQKVRALSDELDAPILVHMVEFPWEQRDTIRMEPTYTGDTSVVQYLADIGFLGDRVLAAHVIYLDSEDMATLARLGVGVGHNPKSNLKISAGLSPAFAMMKAGVDIGLGTDGPMTSNQMDVMTAMAGAAFNARTLEKSALPFTPFQLVYLATMGGAKALDLEDELGSLEVGKKADLVILETQSPNMQPNYDPYATIAFAAYPGNVDMVIVDGQLIVADGALLTVDQSAHQQEWQQVTQRVGDFAATLPIAPK